MSKCSPKLLEAITSVPAIPFAAVRRMKDDLPGFVSHFKFHARSLLPLVSLPPPHFSPLSDSATAAGCRLPEAEAPI